ncbi:MAG: glutamine synthetase [Pseudaminobacter sp.]|nr:glutamine synthetase [Pseudaminobacter sp.]
MVACCSDLAGKVRGKAFPASQFDKRLARGIGWTPTNVQITCFDAIAESPFGSLGDLVLIPDPAARVRVEFGEGEPVEHFAIGNIRHTDGRPWEYCTRSILIEALRRLERVSGLTLFGAFEHEFQFRNRPSPPGDAFSLAGFRAERVFAESLIAAMREAGVSPDTFMKEFGAGQYEVTMGPQRGVTIADHSLITREMVQAVAYRLGHEVTFTPIRDAAGVGNGVHIHMSFLSADGQPATYDSTRRHELSKPAGQFIAGILKYLEAIVAITAPSVVSYLRLTPHRWSAAFNNLGYRDREASVRICPVSDLSDIAKASQFNFEFRAADATASPYLQLAALVHAGVQGIEDGLEAPEATHDDLSLLDAAALAACGHVRLPQTLENALERFRANPVVTGWFPEGFANTYVKHKHCEIAFLKDRNQAEICKAYEEVY